MARNDETILIEIEECRAVTDKARLLRLRDGQEVWFPVSQCPDLEDVERGDQDGEFECPEWLAEEKAL